MTVSGVMTAGVIGRIGAANNVITVDLDGILCGVGAISNITTGLAATNSQVAAFAMRRQAGGSMAWPIGYFVPSGEALIGIQLGDGQSSSAQIGHHLSATSQRAIVAFCDDNNAVLGADCQGIYCRSAVFAAQNANYSIASMRGHLRVIGANILPPADKGWSGVEADVECSGTYTIGDSTNMAYVSGLQIGVEIGGTPTISATGRVCGILLTGGFTAASYTGETIGMLFMTSGGTYAYEHAFGFNDGVFGVISTATHSTNDTHKIAVWINGVGTRYIHLLSD
jgi:hypothetical protein